ncbi:hypothetical protein [Jiangella mangrovi]|uniref:Bacterial Ig-like domain-containing protein n=1 Tax=Jiangella mangrovi TaxID=1524084 RepID=A0A7W9GL94_9ACTN|nr:hypothetical protein [Jiangella mangrovi]MBB5785738.1 hypothetical protein [Jiangella mangrovi]
MSRSSFGRRIASAALAAAAAVGTLAVAAAPSAALEDDTTAAAPATRMRAFDPAEFADRAAQLPPGLAEAVRRDLGLSPEEYLATAAAARLAGEVVGSLGDTVRSAWLDDQTLHVAVTDRDATIAARTAGAEVQVGDVLADALTAARAQDKLVYADRDAERVVAVGAPVRGAPAGQARLSAQAGDDHRGGSGFSVGDQNADYHCSTAFAGTDADDDPVLLTAGHCTAGPEGPFTGEARSLTPPAPLSAEAVGTWPALIGDRLGAFVPGSAAFGDGQDAALLEVDGDIAPEVAAWSPGAGDESALAVHDAVTAVAGAPVCSAGVASGWTCGHILDAQATVPVSGRAVTGFLFDACVLPGDSGGAVVVGQYALGLNSGSTWTGLSCADGDPAAGGDDLAIGYPMIGADGVEGLYGDDFDLAVRVGRPEVTAPADGAVAGTTPTVTGTADAAEGAVVTVRFDDGPTAEASVGPAGRWSATVGEPLDPGTHGYEATTTFRPSTGGREVTSRATTGEFEVAAVAELGVSWPAAGHVNTDGRLAFEGTGQPGATVRLTVGGEVLASTIVGHDGTWSLRAVPTRPAGRFDAVLTQHLPDGLAGTESGTASGLTASGFAAGDGADGGTDRGASGGEAAVTVAGVGVAPSAPVVSAPLGGIPAADAGTLRGAGLPGAAVAVRVAASGADVAAAPELRAEAGADGSWVVRLDAPLAAGRHVVVATQTLDDLTSEPSAPVTLEVASDDAPSAAEADRAGAGSGSGLPGGVLAAALGIVAAGGAVAAALAWRRRTAP